MRVRREWLPTIIAWRREGVPTHEIRPTKPPQNYILEDLSSQLIKLSSLVRIYSSTSKKNPAWWMCVWLGWVVRERERWPLAKVDGRLCTATPTLAARPAAPPSQSQTKPRESADALQQQPHHLLIVVDGVGVEEDRFLSATKEH